MPVPDLTTPGGPGGPGAAAILELLVNHLYWARSRILATAGALPEETWIGGPSIYGRTLRETLVHELDVESSWRERLRGAARSTWDPALDPTEFPSVPALETRWAEDEATMRSWLRSLGDAELAASTTVNGLEGHPLVVYVLHMVQHGLEQLSAAAILLTELGQSPGDIELLDGLDAMGSRDAVPSGDA